MGAQPEIRITFYARIQGHRSRKNGRVLQRYLIEIPSEVVKSHKEVLESLRKDKKKVKVQVEG